MLYYTRFDTPLCRMLLAGNEAGLTRVHLDVGEGRCSFATQAWIRRDGFFTEIKNQLLEYVDGKRKMFSIPLNPEGTVFQKKVWRALMSIPYGEVRTYKDIALAIGNPRAFRAVGQANRCNPLPLVIPCHRVIGSDGKLTGFALGIRTKQVLLDLENRYGKGVMP